jgi:DNA-binding transcriptional LysR family regulator
VAPLVPGSWRATRRCSLSLNLSDRVVDIVNEGFDCAVRVGDLPDSSLVSIRLADNRRLCVAAPAYLQRAGTFPQHPADLARHECLTLSSDASQTRGWAFTGRRRTDPPAAQRAHRLQRRPGAARLVPPGPGAGLAQHLGGGADVAAGRAGGGAGRLCRAAQRHLCGVSPQRKHLPLRVRLWIDFIKHSYGDQGQPGVLQHPSRVSERLMGGMQPPHQHVDEGGVEQVAGGWGSAGPSPRA